MSAEKFNPGSRYYLSDTRSHVTVDGREVVYLARRLVPQASRFELLQEHRVKQGERLDHIAALHLGDPQQYWRICDANGALRPAELVEGVGRWIRITLPEGISSGESGDA